MPPPAPDWQFAAAYALLTFPLLFSMFAGAPYPVPRDHAIRFYVCIGLAVGAALFIVRRRPRDPFGWISLLVWGGLSAASVVGALVQRAVQGW